MKKIRIAETATPASKAADKTSTTCTRQGKGEESKTSVSPRHESTENMKHKTMGAEFQKRGVKQGKRRKKATNGIEEHSTNIETVKLVLLCLFGRGWCF